MADVKDYGYWRVEFEGGSLFDVSVFRRCGDCDADVVGAEIVNALPDSEPEFKGESGEGVEGLERQFIINLLYCR